ncbi:hypothetical protein D3C77_127490 [compost metagenome]
MQGVLIRASLDPAEQSERLLLGGATVDRIDDLDTVALSQRAGASGVFDLQVAAAACLAAIDDQFVGGRLIVIQVGIEGDGAVVALVLIGREGLVAAAGGRAEVDQAVVVAQAAEVRVAGEFPQAGVTHAQVRGAARCGGGGTVDLGACQVDGGQARLVCIGIDVQPLAAAACDHVLEVDVTDAVHGDGRAVLVMQHRAAQVGLAYASTAALQVQGCGIAASGAYGRLFGAELAAVLDQHAMGIGALGDDAGLFEDCRAWGAADQYAMGTHAAGAGNAVVGL